VWLLSDTKPTENITEDLFGGDLAGNFAKVEHALADIL
jgi:hypothetical protein